MAILWPLLALYMPFLIYHISFYLFTLLSSRLDHMLHNVLGHVAVNGILRSIGFILLGSLHDKLTRNYAPNGLDSNLEEQICIGIYISGFTGSFLLAICALFVNATKTGRKFTCRRSSGIWAVWTVLCMFGGTWIIYRGTKAWNSEKHEPFFLSSSLGVGCFGVVFLTGVVASFYDEAKKRLKSLSILHEHRHMSPEYLNQSKRQLGFQVKLNFISAGLLLGSFLVQITLAAAKVKALMNPDHFALFFLSCSIYIDASVAAAMILNAVSNSKFRRTLAVTWRKANTKKSRSFYLRTRRGALVQSVIKKMSISPVSINGKNALIANADE